MAANSYDSSYLEIVKNPLVYQDSIAESASVILRETAKVLDVTRTSLWLLSDDHKGMKCLSLYDSVTNEFESGAILQQNHFPGYFDALMNARVVDASDAFTDPRTNELTEPYLEILDVRSLLDATIRSVHDGRVQGVLCAEMVGECREWTANERMFATSVAELLSQRLITSKWARSSQTYQALYESMSEGIMVFSENLLIEVNPAICEIFRATPDDIVGRSPVDLSPEFQPDGQLSAEKALAKIQACLEGNSEAFDWVHRRIDGTHFDAEITLNAVSIAGEETLFALVRDITEKKKAERQAEIATQELEHRATHDSLTGLRNRDQLHDHASSLIDGIRSSDQRIAMVLLDLNRFKEINDTLGHATGDKVLVGLAEMLDEQIQLLNGWLFRLGGDEFVAIFDSETCTEPFQTLIETISHYLKSSIEVEGGSFEMSASIGAAVYPDNGKDSHELLRCADVAMYHGKNHDGAPLWYLAENDLNDKRRLSMIAELRQAIRQDELILHFQPRISIKTGETTGCEALVRWQHPQLGLLPPGDFLPLAEMSELIHPLSRWVIESAFAQIHRLRSLGYHVPVAVNLSARNLPDTQLFDLIEKRIIDEGISPRLLEIEITESALINNAERSLQNLQRLENLGVSIAIDDFGTGYSSLSLLKRLPLDTLKIDRSFVNDMLDSEPDRVIVSSTVSLAHNFSATVVAEGVENKETLDALQDLDCDQAQGFFIARPMPAGDLEEWLIAGVGYQVAA